MQEKTLNQLLEELLVQIQRENKGVDIERYTADLTAPERNVIQRAIKSELHNYEIEFARQWRNFRRNRTDELLNIAKATELTPALQQQLKSELDQLRNKFKEIKVLLPRHATIQAIGKIHQTRAIAERDRKLAEKEEARLNGPMDAEQKLVNFIFAPITYPVLWTFILWEKYTKTPQYQARKQEKFRAAFRKNWRELHKIKESQDAKRSAAFRELYNKMHLK